MKFTTAFALLATAVTFASAAPIAEADAHRGDGNWRGHGHKYGGNRKYGHAHKQPHVDAAATTDEWDENEPCVSGVGAPAALAKGAAATPIASPVISSSSAVSSSSSSSAPADTPSASPSPAPKQEEQPKPEESKQEEAPKPSPTPEAPKQEEPKKEEPPKDEWKEEPKPQVDAPSAGGSHGQVTTYSVTNPAENHGLDAGTVACYTLGRKFSNSDYIAAVKTSEFDIGVCGKQVRIKGPAGEATVQIVDSCAGGGCKTFDLSPSAMQAVTGDNTGIYDIEYWWL